MLKDEAFHIGRIIKAHGVHGQLTVASNLKLFETDDWPEWIFLDIDGGLVPFRTDPEGMIWRDHKHLVIGLEDYSNQDDVIRFVGCKLWFPNDYKNIISETEQAESPFLGFILMDSTGTELGKIEEFIDLPNNPLFKLTINGEETLIPARDEWVIEMDESEKRIMMDLPDGLVGLSL